MIAQGDDNMIRQADMRDLDPLTDLTLELWPDHSRQEMKTELQRQLSVERAVYFLAVEEEKMAGFAQCQLRYDYVEGTESSPVGYLEGVYIREDWRKKGLARQLLETCEQWAKAQGCSEFASDCELSNLQSLEFHLKAGFTEANRIICFTKKLVV